MKLKYQELIDHGSIFLENMVNIKEITFKPEVVLAIHGKKFTFGEFLASFLKTNSLEAINNYMTTIVGKDFFKLLRNCKIPASLKKNEKQEYKKIFEQKKQWDKTYKALDWGFKQRHVFCHELIVDKPVDIERCGDVVSSTLYFIFSTQVVTQDLLKQK